MGIRDNPSSVILYSERGGSSGKIVLTTGNGFVDKLLLLSIIATELMIGMVIMSVIGG